MFSALTTLLVPGPIVVAFAVLAEQARAWTTQIAAAD
jgi:hypothetical protein